MNLGNNQINYLSLGRTWTGQICFSTCQKSSSPDLRNWRCPLIWAFTTFLVRRGVWKTKANTYLNKFGFTDITEKGLKDIFYCNIVGSACYIIVQCLLFLGLLKNCKSLILSWLIFEALCGLVSCTQLFFRLCSN